jgi:endonuclease/exonuclease/phosphatase family metal-dependent hydrolase
MRFLILLLVSLLLASQAATAAKPPVALRVASYNLRYNNAGDGADAWPNRKEMVKNLVQHYDFDVFGIQEGLRAQLNDVAEGATMARRPGSIRPFSTRKPACNCCKPATSG